MRTVEAGRIRRTVRCQAQHDEGEDDLYAAKAKDDRWSHHFDVVELLGTVCKADAWRCGRMQEGCRKDAGVFSRYLYSV